MREICIQQYILTWNAVQHVLGGYTCVYNMGFFWLAFFFIKNCKKTNVFFFFFLPLDVEFFYLIFKNMGHKVS